ncbi:EAL domain-containing protein (putative c-di-GMP-specific phosphodiesterase class I) [Peribacillus deserti]|uniref:EAL domain-containing protein (Putative c-di-GMP-specific phosphodiesterase class I) n=1 Tax=Peribacillus deserti TaxID=673318 RepID=A0ABS2QNG3_9BACI|nr:EAL domain-containing protein [Peribacillus deserti]MBM7694712.1 EAL domain-containing protein (putative c-di-GMP-specific phosphodiesterase class I) [Peribacillus deserti]
MAYNHSGKKHRLLKWLKILLPHSIIRFYPPQFILRDTLVSSTKRTIQQGNEAAVIVFNIKNLRQISEQIGIRQFEEFQCGLKLIYADVIKESVPLQDILALHDYNSDGITLILRMDSQKQSLLEIDGTTSLILQKVKQRLEQDYSQVRAVFETGYMFVEKKSASLRESINKAHQQAAAMAERKIHSEFNEMLYQMTKIIEGKNIHLLAQPIIDVATKQIKAYEILTRGPQGSLLESPLTLFSVARQTSRLYDLEMVVLEKTFEQVSKNGSSQDIFINFTPITLGNIRFIKDMKWILDKYKNVKAAQIVIEITERDDIDEVEGLIQNIRALRNMGFRIAVDDTGAGYASLHTISEIMPDIIKIDRTVIENIHHSTIKESMLKGLLLIAKEAGSLVVAEGIETEEEAKVLSRNKVDLAQGYFYARPARLEHA